MRILGYSATFMKTGLPVKHEARPVVGAKRERNLSWLDHFCILGWSDRQRK
jgi:hypothetical protein